ncbi:MAG: hypothetical protein EOP49_13270 [Sphingobacteriales bacterium]|nr:MAG: hypothetical protein EOP49_13270 [Sphingobacteriales bacterium]
MKPTYFAGMLLITMFSITSCGENSYEKHSDTTEMTADSAGGLQTGEGTEFIAEPNAANTKRTPVPLDSVVVDTTQNSEKNPK